MEKKFTACRFLDDLLILALASDDIDIANNLPDVDQHLESCSMCRQLLDEVLHEFPYESDEEYVKTSWHKLRGQLQLATDDSKDLLKEEKNQSSPSAKLIVKHSQAAAREILKAEPILLPYGPVCPTPVRLAARSRDSEILFGMIEPLRFRDAVPLPRIQHGRFPIVVTTPYRAQVEYLKGNKWRIALPLAPQKTRIVVHTGSQLYDSKNKTTFNDFELARRLGGCTIAVADRTSSHASRLVLAAREAAFNVEICERLPRKNKKDTLHLVVIDFDHMVDSLSKRKIDGFSTVEPYPTIAKFHLGAQQCQEAVLDVGCTSASSGFCCVALVPDELATQHPETYHMLLRALITPICDLLLGKDPIHNLAALYLETGHDPASRLRRDYDRRTVANEFAARAFIHLTEHLKHLGNLDENSKRLDQIARVFAPDVPKEAILAEGGALGPYLRAKEQEAVRKGINLLPEVSTNLYNFMSARKVFIEILKERFPEFAKQESTTGRPGEAEIVNRLLAVTSENEQKAAAIEAQSPRHITSYVQ